MNKHLGDTKTERVKRELLKMILENELQPGFMLPSEGKIAETYGVSKMTSKMALNELVEAGIIYRVPRQGSFICEIDFSKIRLMLNMEQNVEAVALKSPYVALVIPKIDLYTGQIIKEFIQVASEANYQVVLKVSDGDNEKEDSILKEVAAIPGIKGVVMFPGDKNTCGVELLNYKMKKMPIVMVDRVFKEIEFDSVYHDHYQGAKDIVNYLIHHGHEKIGFVSYDVSEVSSREERYKGYMNAMMEANIHVLNDYVLIKDFQEDGHILKDYLNKNPNMTAVFCADDYIALRLYHAAAKLDIHIPDRLSVVGFTDNEILSYLHIPLTTVRQPVGHLVAKAFEILEGKMKDENYPLAIEKIPTRIVERSSVKKI